MHVRQILSLLYYRLGPCVFFSVPQEEDSLSGLPSPAQGCSQHTGSEWLLDWQAQIFIWLLPALVPIKGNGGELLGYHLKNLGHCLWSGKGLHPRVGPEDGEAEISNFALCIGAEGQREGISQLSSAKSQL